LSGISAATLRRAHAIHPIDALQWEYSLFTLDIESPELNILSTCRELGVTLIAFCPMGRGVLTGHFTSHRDLPETDTRHHYPKYADTNAPAIAELVQGIRDVADAHASTPAQIAIAWLLAQGPEIIPIPGTKSTAKMDENAASALLQLTQEEVQTIRELAEKAEIEGSRYHPA
jgi:aryl-alcohol dehydrogenase-like predicted oxidoreductase